MWLRAFADAPCPAFFMRKGADCLSKWVGEAERQLRLLFDEAKACQPSIIFFDEIDGLAPVRSSKQDQVHASIVSTLLALMDGMDGRGQVVVIGATNRPDAIDPALRRPGRFDREFYFPLPAREAREKIIRIMTKSWDGWDGPRGEENAKTLSELTKGYGGADLRALATEAALNAVQRRYPQIYKSTERLMLKPETIEVELRDFMLAVKSRFTFFQEGDDIDTVTNVVQSSCLHLQDQLRRQQLLCLRSLSLFWSSPWRTSRQLFTV
jgi:SpoVK/Ycf46/Vps4 family AAA+-type ATPase